MLTLFLLGCAGQVGVSDQVLQVGMMIHLENHPHDTLEQHESFRDQVFAYADIFDTWGAKPTWEAKEPLVTGQLYDDPYLKDLADRGHGVGVHLDMGGNPELELTYNQFVTALSDRKEKLEWQGVEAKHVSGICSPLDWQAAVTQAGYEFVTGVIQYCQASLPEEELPDDWDCPLPEDCHEPYPDLFRDRLHPWRSQPGHWTTADPSGDLVILPSADGMLTCLAESKADPSYSGDCELTQKDIDIAMVALQAAVYQMEQGKVNAAYLSWSFGKEISHDDLNELLFRIDEMIQDGHMAWATLPELYESFTENE